MKYEKNSPSEHENEIEVSLDKNKYYTLHRRVDEDGEIYPVRVNPATVTVNPAPDKQKRFRLKGSVNEVKSDLNDVPAVYAESFDGKLLEGEKICWCERAKYSVGITAISVLILLGIFTRILYAMLFNSILPSLAIAIIPAVLIGRALRNSKGNEYAVTNLRLMINDNNGFREIPIERILSAELKLSDDNLTDVVFKTENDTVVFSNIAQAKKLVELLSKFNISIKGTVHGE